MARYIDADALIEKIKAKATEMFTVDSVYEYYMDALIDVEDIIKAEQTADVVPTPFHEKTLSIEIGKRWDMVDVVRCKDCKDYQTPYCPLCHVYKVEDNDFCSYGERKPNDN